METGGTRGTQGTEGEKMQEGNSEKEGEGLERRSLWSVRLRLVVCTFQEETSDEEAEEDDVGKEY